MGRTRKKSRRSRFNLKNSNDNGSRHNLDRDDDFIMHGVEHDNHASPNQRRGQGYSNNSNSNGQSRDGRASKKGNLLGSFDKNPFKPPNMNESTYQDEQGPKFQQHPRNRNRNRTRNRNQQGPDNQFRHQGGSHSTPLANNESTNNHAQRQRRPHKKSIFPPSTPPPPPSPQPSSQPGPGRPRFCLECSAVRRANLTLRDWFSSALVRASEVLDSWSDEVGVSLGSGDEMDWQPEPVVRVVILTASPTTGMPYNAGTGWQQQAHGNVGGAAANSMITPSPWGNRGGLIPGGNNNVGQMMNSGYGCSAWAHNPAFGMQYARMMTSPHTSPSMIT